MRELYMTGDWYDGQWWMGKLTGLYLRDKATKNLLLCDNDGAVLHTLRGGEHYDEDVQRLLAQGL